MTINDAYKLAKGKLQNANVDDYVFDCDCIFEKRMGFTKKDRILNSEKNISYSESNKLFDMIQRRISGEPLQYIIGEWDFMDLTFKVGNGVLIPRPETEMLVEEVDLMLFQSSPKVIYDLCAGTGCIGLTIAKHNPNSKVFLFEKYDSALNYTNHNLKALDIENAEVVKCDIECGCPLNIPKPDIIISNPPYIKSIDIKGLQKEVLIEPITALDGGDDGLYFYRIIAEKWLKLLPDGGILMFECGDGQSSDIMSIFSQISKNQNIIYDFNNIDRVVQIKV